MTAAANAMGDALKAAVGAIGDFLQAKAGIDVGGDWSLGSGNVLRGQPGPSAIGAPGTPLASGDIYTGGRGSGVETTMQDQIKALNSNTAALNKTYPSISSDSTPFPEPGTAHLRQAVVGEEARKVAGGGGADPMAGMDDALVSSNREMETLNQEFEKLGSEAQMAAKASTESFSTLRDRAQNAYKEMKTDYDAWANAVKSGDVEAAKAFRKIGKMLPGNSSKISTRLSKRRSRTCKRSPKPQTRRAVCGT